MEEIGGDDIPRPLRRVQPGGVPRGAVVVEHREEGGDLVAVRVVGGGHVVGRDARRVAGDELVHPLVVAVDILSDLHIRPYPDRRLEVHARGGDLALLAVADSVVKVGLVRVQVGIVEPIVCANAFFVRL